MTLTQIIGDAHCHLADLDDPDRAVQEAVEAGVSPILAVAMGPEDGARVLDLKRRHPGAVLAGVGLHPSRVPVLSDRQVDEEIQLVAARAAEADFIGEIGLDYKDAPEALNRRRQRATLERLLEIARTSSRPVNMHTRRADSDLLQIAREFSRRSGLPTLLHWFTHSSRLAVACGDAGIYISAGPSIEIDPRQAEVCRYVAEEFLLAETDAPVAYAGVTARPAWARRVLEALARARGDEPGQLARTLADNLARYIGKVRPAAGGPSGGSTRSGGDGCSPAAGDR